MPEIAILDGKGTVLERREIPDRKLRLPLLKQAVIRGEANRRTGTAASKVRSQVVGSRRKPWRQKGTGRARAGDRRSPLWKGGGVIFGPHPRDHRQELPRKARREALRDTLLGKVKDSEVVAVDELPFEAVKTRQVAEWLARVGVSGSCLIAVGPLDEPPKGFENVPEARASIFRASRNLPRVSLVRVEDLNVGDLLKHRQLLLSRAGVDFLFPRKPEGEG